MLNFIPTQNCCIYMCLIYNKNENAVSHLEDGLGGCIGAAGGGWLGMLVLHLLSPGWLEGGELLTTFWASSGSY